MTQLVADITVDTKTAWHQVFIGNVQREKRTKSGTVWSFSPTKNEAGVGAKKDDPYEIGFEVYFAWSNWTYHVNG